jgi:hypothetical protein
LFGCVVETASLDTFIFVGRSFSFSSAQCRTSSRTSRNLELELLRTMRFNSFRRSGSPCRSRRAWSREGMRVWSRE